MAAIEFEEVAFAADLLYLMQHDHVDPNSEYTVSGNDWNKVDYKVREGYIESNVLGFDVVNLYCVKLNASDWEVFAARSDEEAKGYMLNKYRHLPKIIKMDKSKWLKEFWFEDLKQYKSLLELRNESNVFPRTLIIY